MSATPVIFSFGYGSSTVGELRVLLDQLDAVCVDVRFSPGSWTPAWRGASLARELGGKYLHVSQFGNARFREPNAPIELANPEQGIAKLAPILAVQSVVLLCACRNVRTCHRRQVAEVLAKATGAPVVHLPTFAGARAVEGQLRLF